VHAMTQAVDFLVYLYTIIILKLWKKQLQCKNPAPAVPTS